MIPCEVCGQPTASKTGVCQRTDECAREYGRRYNGTKMPARTPGPCEVCGHITISKYGVCRTGGPECSAEYARRVAGIKRRGPKAACAPRTRRRRLVAVPPLDVPEEWRPIIGYEGLYEVSDQGRIKSLLRGGVGYVLMLKLHDAKDPDRPYLDIGLRDASGRIRSRRVHHLVAEAFIGPRPKGQVIRHGLGGPSDNRLVNLCYGTPAQNKADKAVHRQMMRDAEGPSEADALNVHRSWAAGELPPRIADEYAAVVRHAELLRRRHADWAGVGGSGHGPAMMDATALGGMS